MNVECCGCSCRRRTLVKKIDKLPEKRGLLKRGKALPMKSVGSLVREPGANPKCLRSWPELDRSDTEEESDDVSVFPSVPEEVLYNLEVFRKAEGNKNLNDSEIEERFARLSLSFRTDKLTLNNRLDLQNRQRDISEKNIDSEMRTLRESLNSLNQLCTDSEMREVITKTQQHVDIVQQATVRMSSRAETYGAIQQEQRMNSAFETMLNYVEHLKLLYDKEHIELEEYRRLLAEHNLLPDEKGLSESVEDSKRNLPPRSHSLSCSSKPENRARLLNSVCLLNNNHETGRPGGSGNAINVSLSPKSRRSSLPVGPMTNYSEPHFRGSTLSFTNRSHGSITETVETPKAAKDSTQENAVRERKRSRAEPESPKQNENGKHDNLNESLEVHSEEDSPSDKDSSVIIVPKPYLSQIKREDSTFTCSVESTCDNETDEEVSLLPEIIVPVTSTPLYIVKILRWASRQRIWHWDNATFLLNARYALSAMLATAAMCSLVLTFMPNLVAAYVTKEVNKKV